MLDPSRTHIETHVLKWVGDGFLFFVSMDLYLLPHKTRQQILGAFFRRKYRAEIWIFYRTFIAANQKITHAIPNFIIHFHFCRYGM